MRVALRLIGPTRVWSRCLVPGVVVLVAGLTTAGVLTAVAGAASTPRFSAPVLVKSGYSSDTAVVAADFNRDGNPDLATAEDESDTVSVLLGDGKGAFRRRAYAVPQAADVAVGDVTGDGHPDLVAVRDETPFVFVLINDGAGHFRRERHSIAGATGAAAQMVAVGDFNGDGISDVAVGGYWPPGDFTVLLATGEGHLAAPITVDGGRYSGGRDLTVGDFNGDGRLDVALAALGARAVRVRLGAGDGTFGPARSFGVADTDAVIVTAAELNNDGKLDLMVGRENGSVGVLLGSGDGTFGVQTNYWIGGAALVGDFDGDGIADIADSGSHWDPMTVRLGSGDGSFGPRRSLSTTFSAFTSRVEESANGFEAIADFNRDGRLDVVIVAADAAAEEFSDPRWIAVRLNWTGLPAPPCVVVPVTHEPLRTAKRHINSAGCRVGKVTYRYSRNTRRRRVISQRPSYGAVLTSQTRVKLIVSRGRTR